MSGYVLEPSPVPKQRRPYVLQTTIDRVELHHSVYPASMGPAEQMAAIEDLHYSVKGWNSSFYNVGLDPSTGLLYSMRGIGNRSTSAAPTAITLVVFGDLRSDELSTAAKDALYWFADAHGGVEALYGHSERPYATACPGPNGILAVELIRTGVYRPTDAPALKLGDDNFAVVGMQIHLKNLGYYAGTIPAPYDKATAVAVASFQQVEGLPVDGSGWRDRDHDRLEAVLARPAAPHRPVADSRSSGSGTTYERINPLEANPQPVVDPPVMNPRPVVKVNPQPTVDPPAQRQGKPPKLPNPDLRAAVTTVLVAGVGIAVSMLGLEETYESVAVIGASSISMLAGFITRAMHQYSNAEVAQYVDG
jgi:peptidoglycan hydrolase-like protein with peptidoglycan-binding domain